jgi:hypothetical protein
MADSTADLRLEIPDSMKLEGPSNYIIWAFKFQNICVNRDLWEVVEKPADFIDYATNVDSKDKVTFDTHNERLRKLQSKVRVILQMWIRDHLLIHIIRITCPHVMWTTFKSMFADASEDRRQLLRLKLSNLRMKESDTIEIHLRTVNEILCELANCGENIKDKELCHTILISLPFSWAPFRTSVKLSCGDDLQYAKLQNYFIDEEMSRELTKVRTGTTEATYVTSYQGILQTPTLPTYVSNNATQRGNRRGHNNDSSSARHYCRILGHWANNCERKKLDLQLKNINDWLAAMGPLPSAQAHAVTDVPTVSTVASPPVSHQANSIEILPSAANDTLLSVSSPTLHTNIVEMSTSDASVMLRSYLESSSSESAAPDEQPLTIHACVAAVDVLPDQSWIFDSAASSHITGNNTLLSSLSRLPGNTWVSTASGQLIPVTGLGSVTVSDSQQINEVFYVTGLTKNLLSIGKLTDQGHVAIFNKSRCAIYHKGNPNCVILSGTRDPSNNLYRLDPVQNFTKPLPRSILRSSTIWGLNLDQATSTFKLAATSQQARIWHKRLGHTNYQRLYHMTSKNLVAGMPPIHHVVLDCEVCLKAKQRRENIPKFSHTVASRPFELVHTDNCGPLPTESLTKSCYILMFTDHYTRYTWLYCLRNKGDAFEKFQEFYSKVENRYKYTTIKLLQFVVTGVVNSHLMPLTFFSLRKE